MTIKETTRTNKQDMARESEADNNYAIVVDNLRKVYRIGNERVVAIDNVSLKVKKGEICCLLGTSGSGKSTLLNLIAGLEKPSRGSISIHGIRIDQLNEHQLTRFRQRNVGFIFQSYNLLATLTALENVALPLTFRRVPRKIRDRRAAAMLKAVGLSTHMRHKPAQMSGGQQQRVGIARAYVSQAPIIFADEPTGNLDSKTTDEVLAMMLDMTRQNNQTMLIVTHNPDIAKYANHIVELKDGNIIKETFTDTPAEIDRESTQPLAADN